jgi:hypothetical protein
VVPLGTRQRALAQLGQFLERCGGRHFVKLC